MSDDVVGFVLRRVCAAWSCTIEDLLAPCAERRWNDTATLVGRDGVADLVGGLWLRRPR